MELDTSRHIIISAPLVSCRASFAPVTGLESPMTKHAKPRQNSATRHHPLENDHEGIRAETRASSPKRRMRLRLPALISAYTTGIKGTSSNRYRNMGFPKYSITASS